MRRPEIVSKIAKTMKLHFPEVETILYGSEARGEARADSDFDLLILLPDGVESFYEEYDRISERLFNIELETGANITSTLHRKSEWGRSRNPFYYNVKNEGIRL